MVERQRLRQILLLGLPIIGGMLSQSLLNLVDAAMVGELGATALAGVGVGSYANFVAVSLVMGLGAGVQALVARRRGEGKLDQQAAPLNAGLLLSFALGIPITLLCWWLAEPIIALLSEDAAVQEVGSEYFVWRCLAVVAVGANFSFRGYWNGTHQSGVYMRTLIIMHVINVPLSYCLIHGLFSLPQMGAAGTGLGTSLALWLGSLIYLVQTWRVARGEGFLTRLNIAQGLRPLLRLSMANSLQQFFFALGITTLFWIIAQVGTAELAVAHVLINLALFLILPGVGMGMAATTLVSQSLGQDKPEEAHRWGWEVVRVAALGLFLLGTPFWLAPQFVLGLFIHEQALLKLGELPLRLTGLGMALDATAIVLTQALLGAGASRTVMAVTLANQWLFFLPSAYLVGPLLGGGLLAIWCMQIAQRVVASAVFSALWQRRHWASIRL